MKCPSCGAETNSAKYCEYCGSELPKNNSNINITNNYYGNATAPTEHSSTGGKCPMCNSTNIKFHRERTGSVGNAQSYKSVFTNTRNNRSIKQNTYQTIGLCQIVVTHGIRQKESTAISQSRKAVCGGFSLSYFSLFPCLFGSIKLIRLSWKRNGKL